jgi:hypothetical protein
LTGFPFPVAQRLSPGKRLSQMDFKKDWDRIGMHNIREFIEGEEISLIILIGWLWAGL